MPSDCPAFFDDQLFTHVGQMSNPFFLMQKDAPNLLEDNDDGIAE
jgi:hypothetical protein